MSRFGKSFHGSDVILPGVYTYTDLSAMLSVSGSPSRAVGIVATGRGGPVGAAVRIRTAWQITQILQGGAAAHMAKLAMDGGAAEIIVARVNKATPATLDVGDLKLTHRNPGVNGNRTQFRRSISTVRSDALDLSIRDGVTGTVENYRAVGPLLDVKYVGADEAPTCTISTASGVVTIALAAGAGEGLTLTSDTVSNIQQAAAVINASSAWTAVVVGDPATPVSVLTGTTATFTANAATLNGGAAAQALALAGSDIVEAETLAGSTSSTGVYQYFSGGSEGAVPTTSDWIDALTILEGTDVMSVAVGSGDGAVIAAARSHVYAMSTVKGRRERTAYVGPSLQGSLAALKTALVETAASYGGERVVVAGNEIMDYDLATGQLTKLPSYYLGAYAAGYKAARRPEESLTNKPIVIPSLAYVFQDEDLEDLSEAGVMIANYDATQGRSIIVDGITSWTQDQVYTRRAISGMDSMDWLNKRVRIALAPFTGKVGAKTLINDIRLAAETVLKSETRENGRTEGVLTPGNDPATGAPVGSYEDLRVVFDGMSVTGITYKCHPVGENKWMFVESTFTPVQIIAQ